ncbi:D-alanyl-D-alanine dipeptidase [Fodinicurvata sp. EGI_FJ10296]|uniref:D-alanyl-D-alanine dipeptidase n=1 Tax=Fodinicurvata sp. EGI_FJ10296 TaxID=3231908 RepID=UPI003452F25E
MLKRVTEDDGFSLDIRYATDNNLLGRPIYARPVALLVPEAHGKLCDAAARARALGLTMKVFDAFRPIEVQWIFWEAVEDKSFVGDPRHGGTHPRGIAVDLTLVDAATSAELDMGTGFDAFTDLAGHGAIDGLSAEAVRNRALLLGIMTAAGWVHIDAEWWHYNLPNTGDYRPLAAADVPDGPM